MSQQNNIQIVKMEEKHIESIVKLEQICFSEPWSHQSLEYELTNPSAKFFVALWNNNVLGYAGMYHVTDEGYLANVAVFPAHRRHGIGQMLIEKMSEYAIENGLLFLSLEVRISNKAAISLYESQQFEKVGVRKNFYQHPREDALIMTKTFIPNQLDNL